MSTNDKSVALSGEDIADINDAFTALETLECDSGVQVNSMSFWTREGVQVDFERDENGDRKVRVPA